MNPPNRQSKQSRFLAELLSMHARLSAVFRMRGMSEVELQRWLRQPRFRRRLAARLRTISKCREIELERAAAYAAEKLQELLNAPTALSNELQRRACVDLIKLQRDREKRRAVKETAAPGSAESLLAPGLGAAEAGELLSGLADESDC